MLRQGVVVWVHIGLYLGLIAIAIGLADTADPGRLLRAAAILAFAPLVGLVVDNLVDSSGSRVADSERAYEPDEVSAPAASPPIHEPVDEVVNEVADRNGVDRHRDR